MNYNGKDYEEVIYEEETIQNEWVEDMFIAKLRVFVSVPVGYDGLAERWHDTFQVKMIIEIK